MCRTSATSASASTNAATSGDRADGVAVRTDMASSQAVNDAGILRFACIEGKPVHSVGPIGHVTNEPYFFSAGSGFWGVAAAGGRGSVTVNVVPVRGGGGVAAGPGGGGGPGRAPRSELERVASRLSATVG